MPYIVRVESGTINRGIYRLAVIDDPRPGSAAWRPSIGWNHKLIVQFDGGGGARYNQGSHSIETVLSDRELSRGFALVNSTELFNAQHSNPHLQGETLMMLREHVTEAFGDPPKWTAGFGGSGGAIQQYLIAQLYPGLLDGIQAEASFPETLMPEVFECRLLNNAYRTDLATWTTAKQNAVNDFNTNTCLVWDLAFANIIKSDNASGCDFVEPTNISNVFNRTNNPTGVRCDIFQTNVALLGTRPGTHEARRPLDNIGVQYGLSALNSGAISVREFLDLNERVGDRSGNRIAEPVSTEAASNQVYPRVSTPRLQAGALLVNDVLQCQLKPITPSDYEVTLTAEEHVRLATIFPNGVCDWSKPSVGQTPLRGAYLRLPLN